MKVDRIELFHVAIPLPKPFYPAWIPGYPQDHNQFTFIRITTDIGVVGESAGMTFGTAHAGYGSVIAPFILGRDPFDVEGFLNLMEMTWSCWKPKKGSNEPCGKCPTCKHRDAALKEVQAERLN